MLLDSALLLGAGIRSFASRDCPSSSSSCAASAFASGSQPKRLERRHPAIRRGQTRPVEQKHLWQRALGDRAIRLNGALDVIASQFKLSARTILAEGAHLAPMLAASDRPMASRLREACRTVGRSKLDESAQRIESTAGSGSILSCPRRKRSRCARSVPTSAEPAQGSPRTGAFADGACARPGHQCAVRRRERHGQDDGGRSARQ